MATCESSVRLWAKYRETRGQAARNALVEYYMPLVHKRANLQIHRLPSCVSEDDLRSAGYEGLIQAVEAYDANRKVVFEAFCQKRILGAMCDWLRQVSHHSRTTQAFLTRSDRVRNTLSTAFGRPAIDEEVADRMGMQQPRFNHLSRLATHEKEMQLSALQRQTDAGASGDSDGAAWEVVDPRPIDPEGKTTRDMLLRSITSGISREERLVLTLHYFEEMTLKEIGEVLDLSESRISQMHTVLLARLRTRLAGDPEYRLPGTGRLADDMGSHVRHPASVQAETSAAKRRAGLMIREPLQ